MNQEIKDSKLSEELSRLSEAVEKSNAFWPSFLLGIVKGFGVVIGATIVATIVLTIVWKVVKTTGLEDTFREFGIDIPGEQSQITEEDI